MLRHDRHGGRSASSARRTVDCPRKVLVVQLDHLGDAVLSTPLIAELRAAYPDAAIDVLASPSNHEVFEADPNVDSRLGRRANLVRAATRPLGLLTAVWNLGRSLRAMRLRPGHRRARRRAHRAGAGPGRIPRRVGWAMGGGAFLLTDVAEWIPGRHEVRSRLALAQSPGITPDQSARVDVHVDDEDRIAIARRLADAWPRRACGEISGASLPLAGPMSERGGRTSPCQWRRHPARQHP